jgi:hypothetical protein
LNINSPNIRNNIGIDEVKLKIKFKTKIKPAAVAPKSGPEIAICLVAADESLGTLVMPITKNGKGTNRGSLDLLVYFLEV